MVEKAVITYDSGTVYKLERPEPHERFDVGTSLDCPAQLLRLGPDGWHTLEYLDARAEQSFGLKPIDDLVDDAKDVIESTYEGRNAALRNVRELETIN